jgi:hypothetical protein
MTTVFPIPELTHIDYDSKEDLLAAISNLTAGTRLVGGFSANLANRKFGRKIVTIKCRRVQGNTGTNSAANVRRAYYLGMKRL